MKRGCSVATLQEEISPAEFQEMMALETMDPTTEERADLRAGIICQTIANTAFGSKGKAKPSDFMPDFNKSRPSTESVGMRLKLFTQIFDRKHRRAG